MTYACLRRKFEFSKKHREIIENKTSKLLVRRNVDVEISSELEILYRATVLAKMANVEIDKEAIGKLIRPTVGTKLATTYFSLEIAKNIGVLGDEFERKAKMVLPLEVTVVGTSLLLAVGLN